jgi:hypothetical protein
MKTFTILALLLSISVTGHAEAKPNKKIVEICGRKVEEEKVTVAAEPGNLQSSLKDLYVTGAADVIICEGGKDKDPKFSGMVALMAIDKSDHVISVDKYFYLHAERQ